jgi:hypothetical protein
MKVTTIALATAFTLTSTFALAQTTGTEGYGSVVAPSVAPASPRLERSAHVEEHRPAASLPSSTVGSASRNTGASIGQARNGFRAPEVKLLTYLRGPALTFSKASFPGCRTRVQQADTFPSELFRAKWMPVSVKKTRQKRLGSGSDSIRTDKAPHLVQHGMARVRQGRAIVTHFDQAEFHQRSQIVFTDR